MNSLTELYENLLVPADEEFAKQASAIEKQAEEEEYAGRIMARGFAEELEKLAMGRMRYGHGKGMYGGGEGMDNGEGKEKKCPGCKEDMSKCKCPD